MRAAMLTGIGRMEVRDVPDPKIERDDDVVMRVEAVGVCGSDIHYFTNGRIGSQQVEFPWTVGHECAGTVLQVGSAVKDLAPGDRVALDPLVVCGRCDQCRSGRKHTCRDQKFLGCPGELPGALSEQLAMPAECFFKIGDSMTTEQGVMVEPLSISVWAAHFAGDVNGKSIGVLGTGTMGLCTLAAVRAAGRPNSLWATDLLDERLRVASMLGADAVVNASTADVVKAGRGFAPMGFDCIFECAGEQETLDQAVELLAPGGKLIIIGIAEEDRISFDVSPLRRKELTVQEVRRQNGTVAPTIQMVAGGKVDVMPLVTHHLPLDRTQEAFEMAAAYRNGVIKAIIHP